VVISLCIFRDFQPQKYRFEVIEESTWTGFRKKSAKIL